MSKQWAQVRLRSISRIVGGGTPTPEPGHWDGEIPFVTPADLRPVHGGVCESTSRRLTAEGLRTGSTLVGAGTVIVSKRAPIGYVARLEQSAAFNQGCLALQLNGLLVEPRFLTWALSVRAVEMNALGRGTTFMEISAGDLGNLALSLPALAEQRAIAVYLNRETAQIDALIGKQERLIETLKERRAAVIDAAFLESSSTRRTRVSHLLSHRPSYGVLVPAYVDDNAGVPFVRVGDLRRLDEATELPRIPPEQSLEFRRTRLDGGEVLLGVVGHMGKAVVAPAWLRGANVARAVAVLRCRPDVDGWLLTRWIGSRHFLDQAALATGNDTAQPTLGMADLTSFSVHWPVNPDEQRRIADYLDEQTAKIDALIAKAERLIELSKERRAALITAAVTGQVDVREAV